MSTPPTGLPSRARAHADTDDAADAFRQMFQRCYQPLTAYVLRREADRATVDDVVGDVFLTAWRRWAEVESLDHQRPWLYRTAANSLLNARRSRRRHLRLVEELAAHVPRTVPLSAVPESADNTLITAFSRLGASDQEVLRLVAWEGLRHAEVAVVLGCSSNAVALRVSRAKKRLHAHLAGEDLESDPSLPSQSPHKAGTA